MKYEVEYLDREELAALQLGRLQKIAAHACANVPYYTVAFADLGMEPGDLKSLDDLLKLPLTDKETLRQNYPYGMFAVPMAEVKEIHASSGTTGKPTVVAYTQSDIEVWSEVMARSLACAGTAADDIVQNAYGYGLFTGGLGVHYGCLELGAAVVPISAGGTRRQLQLMQDFGSTVITCTPSYAIFMAEEARGLGIDPTKTTLQRGLLGAEPWSEGMRREIEAAWDMKAYNIYGLSEIVGPGVAQECVGQCGLHLWADRFLPEIIDIDTGESVEEGEDGMLVLTTLSKMATPFLRYATKDIVSITYETCPGCGRTSPRISRIKGRTDDMLIIRGINVYPREIEAVLLDDADVGPNYAIVVDRRSPLVELRVRAELVPGAMTDADVVAERVARNLMDRVRIRVGVELVPAGAMGRTEVGKVKRVFEQVDDTDPLT